MRSFAEVQIDPAVEAARARVQEFEKLLEFMGVRRVPRTLLDLIGHGGLWVLANWSH